MVVWCQMSNWQDKTSDDVEVMCSNAGEDELEVHSPPVQNIHIV